MSSIKWLLLIVSLVVGPEVSSKGSQPLAGQKDGVSCNHICGDRYFTGQVILCFVLHENNVNILIGRNPTSTQWKFYPLNMMDQHILMSKPELICNRISKGDHYSGHERCVRLEDKQRPKPGPSYYENPYITHPTRPRNDDPDPSEFIPSRYRKEKIDKLKQEFDQEREAYDAASKRSDSSTIPSNIDSYTSEEWENITTVLTKIRDEMTSRRTQDEQRSIADNLVLKMRKVREEAAKSDLEAPKEPIDDLNRKVEKLVGVMGYPKEGKKRCLSMLCAMEKLMNPGKCSNHEDPCPPSHKGSGNINVSINANGGQQSVSIHNNGRNQGVPFRPNGGHPALSAHTNGGIQTSSSVNIKPHDIDIYSSHVMCQVARAYLCEHENIMIYTADNNFCMTNLRTNYICHQNSKNCLQDLHYLLESVQWY